MNDIANLVSTLGFPITACVCMGFYIKYICSLFMVELDKLNTTLDKHTIVLTKIFTKLGEDIEESEDE